MSLDVLAEAARRLRKALQDSPITSCLIATADGVRIPVIDGRADLDRPLPVYSTTKSITSCLIGIAIAQGHLPGFDTTLHELLPEERPLPGETASVTLEHLLMMGAGFKWDEWNEGAAAFKPAQTAKDYTRYTIERDRAASPGEQFRYDSLSSDLLAVILERTIGKDLLDYANAVLFEPLGFVVDRWRKAPSGARRGGSGLRLSPNQLLMLGQLFLQNGQWEGSTVIPEDYLQQVWTMRFQPDAVARTLGRSDMAGFGYGLHWWVHPDGSAAALGLGGQGFWLSPDRTFVATTTTSKPHDHGLPVRFFREFLLE